MTEQLVGKDAEKPTEIPPRGWWQVVRRAFKESSADNVPMLAGGVAFFAFLAIFPAMIAAITLYGLVADPETVAGQVRDLSAALPEQAQPLIADQLSPWRPASGGALGVGLVVSLLAAMWSASSGTGNLIKAINLAYDEEENRGFLKLRGIALALTLGAIVFMLVTLALVAVVPGGAQRAAAREVGHGPRPDRAVGAAAGPRSWPRSPWSTGSLPTAKPPRSRWVSLGALVAAVLWLVGSVAFSLYVNNFGSYNKTYGALAGVVVLMLWLYLTAYIVLLGAEINAESEQQTRTRHHHGSIGSHGRAGRRGGGRARPTVTTARVRSVPTGVACAVAARPGKR